LRPAAGEIAEARWATRADVRKAIEEPGSVPGLGLAGGASIAYRMLQSWSGARPS